MQMGWEYLCGDVVGMVYRYVEVRAYAGGAEKWRIRRGGKCFFAAAAAASTSVKVFFTSHLRAGN